MNHLIPLSRNISPTNFEISWHMVYIMSCNWFWRYRGYNTAIYRGYQRDKLRAEIKENFSQTPNPTVASTGTSAATINQKALPNVRPTKSQTLKSSRVVETVKSSTSVNHHRSYNDYPWALLRLWETSSSRMCPSVTSRCEPQPQHRMERYSLLQNHYKNQTTTCFYWHSTTSGQISGYSGSDRWDSARWTSQNTYLLRMVIAVQVRLRHIIHVLIDTGCLQTNIISTRVAALLVHDDGQTYDNDIVLTADVGGRSYCVEGIMNLTISFTTGC